jgi:thiamine biosynthesis lipoprotein ApbE
MKHHIIDPRNGMPSVGQSSATVLTLDPVRADVAATALMIDGFSGYRELAPALEIDDFMVIGEGREILLSQSLAEKIQLRVSWPVTIIN